MSKSGHPWKVYDSHDEHQATCRHLKLATAIVSILGPGSTIRMFTQQHLLVVVWKEGVDGRASASFDAVYQRLQEVMARSPAGVRSGTR